jgi:putative phosphoesterase
MRLALIADIHGNDLALNIVLAHIEQAGADQIICLGDVACLGPHPNEVIAVLRQREIACVMGNHDAFLLEPGLIQTYNCPPVIEDCVAWCRDRLNREELEFIKGFKPTISLAFDQTTGIFLFHGSPRSHMEDILAFTPPDKLDQMLAGHEASVMAGGHTHIQMLRQHKGTLLINPGSVGCPFKEYVAGQEPEVLAHAEYALLDYEKGEIAVSLRRLPLDRKTLRQGVEHSDIPLRDMILRQYA